MKLYHIMYWTRRNVGAYATRFIFAKSKADAVKRAEVKQECVISIMLA